MTSVESLREAGAPCGELDYWNAYITYAESVRLPSKLDRTFRDSTPPKREDLAEPPELSPSTLWVGHQVVLTSGQRTWMRDRYEMTPTQTVIVSGVEHFPAPYSDCVAAITLESMRHSAEKGRRKIIVSARIHEFGKFISESASIEHDAKLVSSERAKRAAALKTKTKKSRKAAKPTLEDDYSDYIA